MGLAMMKFDKRKSIHALMLLILIFLPVVVSFTTAPISLQQAQHIKNKNKCLFRSTSNNNNNENNNDDESLTSSFENSGVSSKGIVSSLTGLVNFVMDSSKGYPQTEEDSVDAFPSPSSPTELMEKIGQDYTENNYLWTGDIYLSAFEENCRFTDPTLSFEGRDKFVSNVQNLRPIVDALIEPGGCRSDLLQIDLNEKEGYVQSRWNMVGELNALPWKPKIDVIGRTKFWYNNENNKCKVFLYDECWELPAGKALLQLITPGGTIPNTAETNK